MIRFAAFSAQFRASALPALFVTSGAAYLVLAIRPHNGTVAELCGSLSASEFGRLVLTAPWMLSPGQLALDWGLMVIAMMTPLIAPVVSYVRRSVSADRRQGAMVTFFVAYWAVWCAAFLVLFPLAVVLTTLVGDQAGLPVALLIAMIYSASPLGQKARNACHQTIRMAPFGIRAWVDGARQGIATGLPCIAACWPWMLVPLTAVAGHMALMVIVGIYLFAERIAPHARPVWQMPRALETFFGPLILRSAGRLSAFQLRRAQ